MSKKFFTATILIILISFTLLPFSTINAETSGKAYIQLSKSSITMKIGQVLQINASLKNPNKNAVNITKLSGWSAENKNIINIEAGRVRALKEGSTIVTVSYNSYKTTLKVTVKAQKTLLGIELSQNLVSLNVGEGLQLTVNAYYNDKTMENITSKAEWSIDSTDIAQVNKGKISALLPGEVSLKVTYKNFKADATITVVGNVSLLGLEASTSDLNMVIGEEKQINITANYSNETAVEFTNHVKWSIDNQDIVSVDNGRIKALKPGRAIIKAAAEDSETYINVEVLDSSDSLPSDDSTLPSSNTQEKKVTQLKLSNQNLSMKINDSSNLLATVTYSDGSIEDVTNKASWLTENSNIAGVNSGLVSAKTPGFTTIKVSFKDITTTCSIMVTSVTGEKTIIGVRFSTFSLTVKVGEVYYLSVTVTYSDGSSEDITDKATWSVESSRLASASAGKVTGISGGNAVVKATYEGKSTYANVKVIN